MNDKPNTFDELATKALAFDLLGAAIQKLADDDAEGRDTWTDRCLDLEPVIERFRVREQQRAELREINAGLLEACKAAQLHTQELWDAWQRGAINERDGLGGIRSNRNMEVDVALRAAIAKAESIKMDSSAEQQP